MAKTQLRGQGGWASPGIDLGRAGAREPPESPSQARNVPCESAEGRPGLGPDSAPGQSLLEWADPAEHPRMACCSREARGADSGLPVTTTCRPEPRVLWTHHTEALTVLPQHPWGSQGTAICPHCPPLLPPGLGRPWLNRGTKCRKAALCSADDSVGDFVQDPHGVFLSLDPGPQGPPLGETH